MDKPHISMPQLQAILQKIKTLQSHGFTDETSPELAHLHSFVRSLSAHSPVVFTPDQRTRLKNQIAAFQLLLRGSPVPDYLQVSVLNTSHARKFITDQISVERIDPLQAAAVDVHLAAVDAEEQDGVYPYSSYTLPFTFIRTNTLDPMSATKQQRIIVPSLMPRGVDPVALAEERNAQVKHSVARRIAQIEALSVQIGHGPLPVGSNARSVRNEASSENQARSENEVKNGLQNEQKSGSPSDVKNGTQIENGIQTDVQNGTQSDIQNNANGIQNTNLNGNQLQNADTPDHISQQEVSATDAVLGGSGLSSNLVSTNNNSTNNNNNNNNNTNSYDGRQSSAKMRALIELKSLRLLDKQKALRQEIIAGISTLTSLSTDRAMFRRFKRQTLRDARATEEAERAQRIEREQASKSKHVGYVEGILIHRRALIAAASASAAKFQRLGRAVQRLHADTKAEEAKRIERISKERLKALRNDDEAAYMALIDSAKDTRITHLLKQTDAYLDSLASAVISQQNDGAPHSTDEPLFEVETGPANEAMFGAIRTDDAAEDQGKLDYYAVAHRIQEKITSQPTILVGGTLKEYQIKGLQWMISLYNNRLNGILADEMGLGKTIQTISLITHLVERKRVPGPFLVIVPLSTMTNWIMEFEKWAPSVSVVAYKGTPNQRKVAQHQIRSGHFQVLLTTYEYIIKDRPLLARTRWEHMIIDEGHRMKNTQSKLSQTLTQHYFTRHRLILTGTPLQNNLPELWALLNFVLPKIFNSVKSFDEWFNAPFAGTGGQDKIETNEEENLLIIRRLHKVLRPFLLRRLKKDVESELPDKVEKLVYCRMSSLQQRLYTQMIKFKRLASDEVDATGKIKAVAGLQNMLVQLRKICNHPYVFPAVERAISPAGNIDDNLWRTAGKFELLDRILPKLKETGHRVLMFFQWTEVMNIMEDFLRYRGLKSMRLDGMTKQEDRSVMLKSFNAPDSDTFIFLLSTRAGGLGLNLQTADTVIIYDSDWNPQADLQAQDRAHRIGQKKEVRIFRLVHSNTVEEKILDVAKGKLDMEQKVIHGGRFDNQSNEHDREEFLRSILTRDEEAADEEQADMDDDDLNDVLARGDDEIEIFQAMDRARILKAQDDWRNQGNTGEPPSRLIQLPELPIFYQNDNTFLVPDVEEEEQGRGQRARTSNKVRYDDGLSEEQWLKALEDDNVNIEDVVERRHQNMERRRQKALLKAHSNENGVSGSQTPISRGRSESRSVSRSRSNSWNGSSSPSRGRENSRPVSKRGRGRGKGMVGRPQNAESPSELKRKRDGISPVNPPSPGLEAVDTSQSTKRRKTQKKEAADLSVIIGATEMYNAMESIEDQDGRLRYEIFAELPSKKLYPSYYQMILRPISMAQIRKRMDKNQYQILDDCLQDWYLMFNNARIFNEEGSQVFEDANEMQALLSKTYERIMAKSAAAQDLSKNISSGASVQITGIKLKLGGRKRDSPPKTEEVSDFSSDNED